jgi:hypothetical protein
LPVPHQPRIEETETTLVCFRRSVHVSGASPAAFLYDAENHQRGVSMTTEGDRAYKVCPMCAEHIKPEAIVCRHCSYDYRTRSVGGIATNKYNGLAIASLVLGIIWVYWIGSILAIVFGHIALRQIKESDGTQTGRGMAIAGVVLGYIGLVTILLLIVLLIVGTSISTSFDTLGTSVQ